MRTTKERVNNLRNRYRRVTNQTPEQAIVGDKNGVLRYATTPPSCVECRVITSDGLSGPRPIFFPRNINVTLTPGATVYVGWKYGRESILDPNTVGETATGVDSTTSTMTAQSTSAPQSGLATLKCIASTPPDTFVHLQAWNVIINGVYYDVFGLSIDLAADIPVTGEMGFAVVAVTTALAIESATSTPRPTDPGDPLDADDVNEALPSLTSDSTSVWAIALMNDQATITQANIDNLPSRDLRQVVNATQASTVTYPNRSMMHHIEAIATVGNALVWDQTNLQAYQDTPSSSDKFTNGFWLETGTYSFHVLGNKASNRGIIDWYVDGVQIVNNQDWYNATQLNAIISNSSITISTDGHHVLEGRVDGKNASSSDYYLTFFQYWFKPTAD